MSAVDVPTSPFTTHLCTAGITEMARIVDRQLPSREKNRTRNIMPFLGIFQRDLASCFSEFGNSDVRVIVGKESPAPPSGNIWTSFMVIFSVSNLHRVHFLRARVC